MPGAPPHPTPPSSPRPAPLTQVLPQEAINVINQIIPEPPNADTFTVDPTTSYSSDSETYTVGACVRACVRCIIM